MSGRGVGRSEIVEAAAALLREHFTHAVIIIADGDEDETGQYTRFIGNWSCCRGLLADAYEEEFDRIDTLDDDADDDEPEADSGTQETD